MHRREAVLLWRRRMNRLAGRRRQAARRRRAGGALLLLGLIALTAGIPAGAVNTTATAELGPFAVGRALTVDPGEPVMQPEFTGGFEGIAAVPHSGAGESWAIRGPSFFKYTYTTGWREIGAPVDPGGGPCRDSRGTMITPGGQPGEFAHLALAQTGEGWAFSRGEDATVQSFGLWFHRRPGSDTWQCDSASANPGSVQPILSLSVTSDGAGTYGYALFTNAQVMCLNCEPAGTATPDHWVADTTLPVNYNDANEVGYTSVTAISRDEGWAVGSMGSSDTISRLDNLLNRYQNPPVPPDPAQVQRDFTQLAQGGVILLRRLHGAWQQASTGRPEFDRGVAPVDGGLRPNRSIGSFVIAIAAGEGGNDLWTVGTIEPAVDPGNPTGRLGPSTTSTPPKDQPLVLHGRGTPGASDWTWTSFCGSPSTGSTGDLTSTDPACDQPLVGIAGTDHLGSLAVVGGDVFAAGSGSSQLTQSAGLYHFLSDAHQLGGGRWVMAPDSVGTINGLSFSSPTEGWVTPLGAPLLGHWTTHPEPSHMARWPQANTSALLAVATDPGGSGAVMAVGRNGTIMRLEGAGHGMENGWQPMASPAGMPSGATLRSISWRAPNDAWAVGDAGLIIHYDGHVWALAPGSGQTREDLYSVSVPSNQPQPAVLPPVPTPTPLPTPTPAPTPPPGSSEVLAFGTDANQELGYVPPPHVQPTPKSVGSLSGITDVAAGSDFSLALTEDGRVYSWGDPAKDDLGRPTPDSLSAAIPGQIVFPTNSATGRHDTIRAVAAGGTRDAGNDGYALALSTDRRTLYAWGDNTYGQLGQQNPVTVTPVGLPSSRNPVVVQLPTGITVTSFATGGNHAVAALSDGSVYTWGLNDRGQLGRGDYNGGVQGPPLPIGSIPLPVAGLHGVAITAVAAGARHTLALSGDGTLYSWGDDDHGELGYQPPVDTSATGLSSPPQTIPTQVPGAPRSITKLAARGDYNLALDSQGQVYEWGFGAQHCSTGICSRQFAGKKITNVAVGGGDDDNQSASSSFGLAVDADGHAWSFGHNDQGQLGLGFLGDGSCPLDPSVCAAVDVSPPRLTNITVTRTTANGKPVVTPIAAGSVHSLVHGILTTSGQAPQPAVARRAASSSPSRSSSSRVSSVSPRVGSDPSAPAEGYAVGTGGVILADRGGAWSVDPQSATLGSSPRHRTLTSVAATQTDFLAAGERGTLISSDGHTWTDQSLLPDPAHPSPLAQQLGTMAVDPDTGVGDPIRVMPQLAAIAVASDGAVFIGGSSTQLLERPAGFSGYRVSDGPGGPLPFIPNGTALHGGIHSLSVQGTAATGRHFAGTVGSNSAPDPSHDPYGWLLASDGHGWRDAEHGWASMRAVGTEYNDGSVLRDPAFQVVLDPGRTTGWAVGGNRVGGGCNDEVPAIECVENKVAPRSSIWRIDVDGEPQGPPLETDLPVPTGSGVSFAFLANTGCRDNSCALTTGRGTRADVVAVEALREIATQTAFAGGPRLVALGGDLRVSGTRGELDPIRHLLDTFSAQAGVPVFGAIGSRDLETVQPPTTPQGVGPSTQGVTPSQSSTSNAPYLSTFADRPGPWGHGDVPAGFRAVTAGTTGSTSPTAARTHYAVDYAPGGTPQLRLVFLDTSVTPLSGNDPNQSPQESQYSWLNAVVADARLHSLPVVALMSNPVVAPAGGGATDPTVTSVLLSSPNVAAAVSGGLNTNALTSDPPAPNGAPPVPIALPIAVGGGGGGPLDWQSANSLTDPRTVDPTNGQYHSWLMVTVDTADAPTGREAAVRRTPVTIRSIPVLESVALTAPAGRSTDPGRALALRGLGRLPDVGTANTGSPNPPDWEGRVGYLNFPFPRGAGTTSPGGGPGSRNDNVMPPDYHFMSSNQGVVMPVREDPAHLGKALIDATGHSIYDETSGLFCGVGAGTATVMLQAGAFRASMPVTVSGAADAKQCGVLPPPPPVVPTPPTPPPGTLPAVKALAAPQGHHGSPVHPPKVPQQVVAPPPAVVVPPAPLARVDEPLSPVRQRPPLRPVALLAPPPAPELVPAPPGGISAVGQAIPESSSVPEEEEEREVETADVDSSFVRAHHPPPAQFPWQQGALEVAGTALAAWLIATPLALRRRQQLVRRARWARLE